MFVEDNYQELMEVMVTGARRLLANATRAEEAHARFKEAVEASRRTGDERWKEVISRRSAAYPFALAAATGSLLFEETTATLQVDRGGGARLAIAAFGKPLPAPRPDVFRVYFLKTGRLIGWRDITAEEIAR